TAGPGPAVRRFRRPMKRIDLHIHTRASDGHASPTAVVDAAVAGRLDVIAVTDHDTVAGVREACDAARERPVRVVPGIEVSARHADAEIHVLGYFVDPEADPLVRHSEGARERRADRARRMVGRLQEQGVPLEFEDVLREAGPNAASIGRPHIARALLAGGHTRYYGEAFDLYLADGRSAFVLTEFPTVREAIDMIHAGGGLAVWAHPPMEMFDREIRTFAAWGLDGVECFRPGTPPAESHLLETAARSLGLLRSGGSDWHGPHRSQLGQFAVREDVVRDLLDAGSRLPPRG
ncbi:MAG TPA: PHP domain-containing protein, partial [Longimicrobiaceae bacterium]|nr:PHP domain-containing protein [Longimicrobiaceae bacterium]